MPIYSIIRLSGMAWLICAVCLYTADSLGQDKGFSNITVPDRELVAQVGQGDLYALVVGLSKYKHSKIPNLNVSDKDAKDFAGFISGQKKLFRNVYVRVLTNEQATRLEIEKEFSNLRKAGKNDTVIVFLSGHGIDDPNSPGEYFFLSYDADPDYLAASAVQMSRQSFINRLDSKRVLLIADSCQSGGFVGRGTKRLPPSLDKMMGQFKESKGRVLITSSRADEYSKESPERGNSLFTYYLLDGLKGNADKDGDGIVSLKEMYEYVYAQTKDASNGYQHPQMEGRIVGSFPVALTNTSNMSERPEHAGRVEQKPNYNSSGQNGPQGSGATSGPVSQGTGQSAMSGLGLNSSYQQSSSLNDIQGVIPHLKNTDAWFDMLGVK